MTTASPLARRPLSAILAGAGALGEAWLPALAGPEAEALGLRLWGVWEPEPDRGTELLARRGLSLPVWDRISDALAPEPDLVVDCTTPNARLAVTREALLSGAHVLCAGLLAADESTAAQLIGAQTRARGVLAVSQDQRFQPGVRQLRDLVRGETLGAAQTLFADLHMAPRFGGLRESMRHVLLREAAIHAFDTARCILGADAMSVACLERTPEGQPFAAGPEAHASFEMTDGSLFVFHGNWTEAGPPSSWDGDWRLTLVGGAARWDGEGKAQAWASAPPGAEGPLPPSVPHPLPAPPAEPRGVLGVLHSVVRAIRAGRPPETHARDNAASLAMVLAAIRSAENGGRREPVRRLGDLVDASGLPRRVPVREG